MPLGGNPDVVFSATRAQTWTGPAYYRLGFLHPPKESASRPNAMQAPDRELRLVIRWGDLGSPTKPGTFNCRGRIVDVQQRNIEAARGNPDARFSAMRIRPHTGREYYILGKIDSS